MCVECRSYGCIYWFVLYLKKEGCSGKSILSRQKVLSGERFNTLEESMLAKYSQAKSLHLLPHESVTCVLPSGMDFI